MNKKINKILTIANIVALALGILVGFLLPGFATAIKPIGNWFIYALKVIIGPLIFCSMTSFFLNRDKTHKFLLGKTVLLFIIMFIATFLITSVIVFFAKPGSNFVLKGTGSATKQADFSFGAILSNLLPKSIDDFFQGKCIFFIIVLTLLIALIISFTPAKQSYAKGVNVFKKYVDALLKLIMFVCPFAVLSLVSNLIATYDVKTFQMGLVYILFAYGLSVVAIILVMILPVWIICKINPLTYIRKASKVWLMTVTTCSSAATLPYTIKVCNEEFGVKEKITDVVVPLGCTIHMCGGAVSFSLLGFFVAQMSGITVTVPMFLLMVLSATLINMAAPGIPGGGVVIGFTYLNIFGFPLDTFYGVYAGIYKFLDMSYTTLNVTGDISANVILDHFEKRKSDKKSIPESEQA